MTKTNDEVIDCDFINEEWNTVMNKQEFTNYMAQNFDFSQDVAETIITLFSETVYLAISEGHQINVDNFGKFATKNVANTNKKVPYFTAASNLKTACTY